mgnify:CR=1 FL=1|jgi:hypothetical protein
MQRWSMQRWSMQPGTRARSRAPPPCAPARPRHPAGGHKETRATRATTIWKDRPTVRRTGTRGVGPPGRCGLVTATAVTTTVTMAATTADSTVAHSMTTAVVTTVATVAATKDSACSARHSGVHVSCGLSHKGQRGTGSLGRHCAGRWSRARFHLPFAAAWSCWSCWSR